MSKKTFAVDVPVWATIRVEARSHKEAIRKVVAEAKCSELHVETHELTGMDLSPVATIACDPEDWIGVAPRLDDEE
jgi:hypothetical protein